MELTVGLTHEVNQVVTLNLTASAFGSGLLDVFATPAMIAQMERTAVELCRLCLTEDKGTVGTHVNVSHVAATPVGMNVRSEAELIEIDRKRLVFTVKAFDEVGLIGEGTHERFIIDNEKFFAKCEAKKSAV